MTPPANPQTKWTTLQRLTPPAAGAIATLRLRGPEAWNLARQFSQPFRSASWPDRPTLHQTHFVRWSGDEIILAVRQVEPELVLELHTHGGVQIVRRISEELRRAGVHEHPANEAIPLDSTFDLRALEPLSRAKTMLTASHLLDQYHGAFRKQIQLVQSALQQGDREQAQAILEDLISWSHLGPRLVVGWKVVIAGAPNVGKSSLMNRLAGYDRAVVSPIAGTTRDVVTTGLALQGWPMELADTAGVRATADGLEAEGIRRAQNKLSDADLVIWLLDATCDAPQWPTVEERSRSQAHWIMAWNKVDERPIGRTLPPVDGEVSAKSGEGIAELLGQIVTTLVPRRPEPGQALPFTTQLVTQCAESLGLLRDGKVDAVVPLLHLLVSGD